MAPPVAVIARTNFRQLNSVRKYGRQIEIDSTPLTQLRVRLASPTQGNPLRLEREKEG